MLLGYFSFLCCPRNQLFVWLFYSPYGIVVLVHHVLESGEGNQNKRSSFQIICVSAWQGALGGNLRVMRKVFSVQLSGFSSSKHMICQNSHAHPVLRRTWAVLSSVSHRPLRRCASQKTCSRTAEWEGPWLGPPTSARPCLARVFVCQTVRVYVSHVCPQRRKLRLLSCFAKLRRAAVRWLLKRPVLSPYLGGWGATAECWSLVPRVSHDNAGSTTKKQNNSSKIWGNQIFTNCKSKSLWV